MDKTKKLCLLNKQRCVEGKTIGKVDSLVKKSSTKDNRVDDIWKSRVIDKLISLSKDYRVEEVWKIRLMNRV